jgi:hypothetical protein
MRSEAAGFAFIPPPFSDLRSERFVFTVTVSVKVEPSPLLLATAS